MKSLLITHIGLLPTIFELLLFTGAIFVYFFAKRKEFVAKCFIGGGVVFYLFYPFLLSVLQYLKWAADSTLGKAFLTLPLDPATPCPEWLRPLFMHEHGYFLFYILGRFWLHAVLAFVGAFLFYLLLQMIRRAKPYTIDPLESLIGFILALALGWPGILIFILLTFVFVFLHSLFNTLLKKPRTRIMVALFLAFVFAALLPTFFKNLLHLTVLII